LAEFSNGLKATELVFASEEPVSSTSTSFYPEDEGKGSLEIIGNNIPDYTMPYNPHPTVILINPGSRECNM
jgi:hypothetical protein